MTALPPVARALARRTLGVPEAAQPTARSVGGGCISEAARVEAAGRAVFLKWRDGAPADFFDAEADGLDRLRAAGLRVPRVLGHAHDGRCGAIALEALDEGAASARAMADAGRRLALLHGRRGLAPGLARDNYIGSLPQPNAPEPGGAWLAFWKQRRLLALSRGLPQGLRQRLERLDPTGVLAEPEGGCALLHGDLWSGNLLCDREGLAWFIDPAVYAGHPEVDLAMTRLFGGFPAAFYDAYQEVAGRFDREHLARCDLLNLTPLIVHARLFGAGYLSQVESVLTRFGA